MGIPGNRQPITVVGSLLEDDVDHIMLAAVEALPQAAQKAGRDFGAAHAIAEAAARLDD